MCGKFRIGHGHCCTKIFSLHFAPPYHYIGRLDPYVLHLDWLGGWGQVLSMDSHTTGVLFGIFQIHIKEILGIFQADV